MNIIIKKADTSAHREEAWEMKKIAIFYIAVIILSTVFSIKIADTVPKYNSEGKAELKGLFEEQNNDFEK